MTTYRIRTPWTTLPLSLNSRHHWAAKAAITRQIRSDVGWLLIRHKVLAMDHAAIWLEWTPNGKRHRDTDNMIGTLKPAIDAIVAAGLLPEDTQEFVTRPECVIHPPIKGLPFIDLVIETVR